MWAKCDLSEHLIWPESEILWLPNAEHNIAFDKTKLHDKHLYLDSNSREFFATPHSFLLYLLQEDKSRI